MLFPEDPPRLIPSSPHRTAHRRENGISWRIQAWSVSFSNSKKQMGQMNQIIRPIRLIPSKPRLDALPQARFRRRWRWWNRLVWNNFWRLLRRRDRLWRYRLVRQHVRRCGLRRLLVVWLVLRRIDHHRLDRLRFRRLWRLVRLDRLWTLIFTAWMRKKVRHGASRCQ